MPPKRSTKNPPALKPKGKVAKKQSTSRQTKVKVKAVPLPKKKTNKSYKPTGKLKIQGLDRTEVKVGFTGVHPLDPPTVESVRQGSNGMCIGSVFNSGKASAQEEQFRKFLIRYLQLLKTRLQPAMGFAPMMPCEPFTLLVLARRNSGKSYLCNRLVRNCMMTRTVDYATGNIVQAMKSKQYFKEKIFVSQTAKLDQSMDKSGFDRFICEKEGLIELFKNFHDEYAKGRQDFEPTLVMMDDVTGWLDHTNKHVQRFVTMNRHYKCSMMILAQNTNDCGPSTRNNLSELVLFQILNEFEYRNLKKASHHALWTYYEKVDWTRKYNFLYMTTRPGPVTYFFQRADEPKGKRNRLMFDQTDVTVRLEYMGCCNVSVKSFMKDGTKKTNPVDESNDH